MIGWLAYQRGQLGEALIHLNKADRIEPYRLKVQIQLAMTHSRLRQGDEAEKRLRLAVEINPRRIDACQLLANLLHQRRQFKEALLYAHRAARLTEYKDIASLMALSEIAEDAGKTSDALTAARMAARLAEDSGESRQLAQIRQRLQRLQQKP